MLTYLSLQQIKKNIKLSSMMIVIVREAPYLSKSTLTKFRSFLKSQDDVIAISILENK